jgi:quinol monooxygenase YgiN
MTVLMLLRIKADAAKLEAAKPEISSTLRTLAERGKERGVLRHRFFATDDEVLVVDEWPSQEAFQQFMAESPEIQDMFAVAGATGEPDFTFARKVDLGDEIG